MNLAETIRGFLSDFKDQSNTPDGRSSDAVKTKSRCSDQSCGPAVIGQHVLLALEPPPLSVEGYNSLSASDRGPFLDEIFKTAVPARPEQWKFIYIHHSATPAGDARTLARAGSGLCDHFVIGNGDGCQDGEIQVGPRWNHQQAPAAPLGVDHIEPTCISICLVGDFDHSMPTPVQLRRLTRTGYHPPKPVSPRGRQGHTPERHSVGFERWAVLPRDGFSRSNSAINPAPAASPPGSIICLLFIRPLFSLIQ